MPPAPRDLFSFIETSIKLPILRCMRRTVQDPGQAAVNLARISADDRVGLDAIEEALEDVLLYAKDPQYLDELRDGGVVRSLMNLLRAKQVVTDLILNRMLVETVTRVASNSIAGYDLYRQGAHKMIQQSIGPDGDGGAASESSVTSACRACMQIAASRSSQALELLRQAEASLLSEPGWHTESHSLSWTSGLLHETVSKRTISTGCLHGWSKCSCWNRNNASTSAW